MKDIILIGGGGHCHSCIDVIESTGEYSIKGILDIPERIGEEVLGYPIIGTDDSIKNFIHSNVLFCITLGQMKAGPTIRKKIFVEAIKVGAQFPKIISPEAYVSRHANIGRGTIVMHGAVINAGVSIGNNCIINSNAIIEHDTVIREDCHISTASVINGNCIIGKGCFIGSSTVIRNNISIVDDTTVGMSAVVSKNLDSPAIYIGCPARKMMR